MVLDISCPHPLLLRFLCAAISVITFSVALLSVILCLPCLLFYFHICFCICVSQVLKLMCDLLTTNPYQADLLPPAL